MKDWICNLFNCEYSTVINQYKARAQRDNLVITNQRQALIELECALTKLTEMLDDE